MFKRPKVIYCVPMKIVITHQYVLVKILKFPKIYLFQYHPCLFLDSIQYFEYRNYFVSETIQIKNVYNSIPFYRFISYFSGIMVYGEYNTYNMLTNSFFWKFWKLPKHTSLFWSEILTYLIYFFTELNIFMGLIFQKTKSLVLCTLYT